MSHVIGIASGKGGVGKTTVSVNLAVALRRRGFSVWLFDADLGLANAQLALGCQVERDLSHVMGGQAELGDILVRTPSGVELLPGPSGDRHMAALSEVQAYGLIQALSEMPRRPDFLIVDLPAGIAPSTLAFLGATDDPVVVVTDNPASVADAYATVKILWRDFRPARITLLPNMAPSQRAGRELFDHVNAVCMRHLDRHLHYLTSIEQDASLVRCFQAHQPVLLLEPQSGGAAAFNRLADAVLRRPQAPQPEGIGFFRGEGALAGAGWLS